MTAGASRVDGFRRLVSRHGTLIGLPILFLIFVYSRNDSVKIGLLIGVLGMVYFWCLMVEATDTPGAPLRRNIRVLQVGFVGAALAVVGASLILLGSRLG